MKTSSGPMGRPRAFSIEAALDAAIEVFGEKEFAAASISDLTGAMGINPPSLYAAYGHKEELFRKAIAKFTEGIAGVRKRRKQDAGSNALPSPLRPAGTVSGWRAGLEHAASIHASSVLARCFRDNCVACLCFGLAQLPYNFLQT